MLTVALYTAPKGVAGNTKVLTGVSNVDIDNAKTEDFGKVLRANIWLSDILVAFGETEERITGQALYEIKIWDANGVLLEHIRAGD